MKILLTGASSFTGMWFARELARTGNKVVATFQKRPEEYADELRRKRVSLVLEVCEGVFGCSFGGTKFLDLAGRESWDLFCHHAADVTNYKSPDFDLVSAIGNNTRNIAAVLDAFLTRGHPRILLTGSVFENDEGVGSEGLRRFHLTGFPRALLTRFFGITRAELVLRSGSLLSRIHSVPMKTRVSPLTS